MSVGCAKKSKRSIMIKASQFFLSSVQVALWLPKNAPFSQPLFLRAVLSPHAERYDGDLQAIPFPADAPAELPRLVLESKNEQWKLQAGPARMDSFWYLLPSEEPSQSDPEALVDQCVAPLLTYLRETNLTADRAAIVLNRFLAAERPAQALVDRFCTDEAKAGPLRDSQTFELHNHKRYLLEDSKIEVNSWVRCKTVNIIGTGAPAISVEQDINTSEEQGPIQFNLDGVLGFVHRASIEADAILRIYFPE